MKGDLLLAGSTAAAALIGVWLLASDTVTGPALIRTWAALCFTAAGFGFGVLLSRGGRP